MPPSVCKPASQQAVAGFQGQNVEYKQEDVSTVVTVMPLNHGQQTSPRACWTGKSFEIAIMAAAVVVVVVAVVVLGGHWLSKHT